MYCRAFVCCHAWNKLLFVLYAAANVVGGVVAAAVVVSVWSLVCSGVMFVRACVCVCMCEYVCVCVVVYYDYLSNLVRLPEKHVLPSLSYLCCNELLLLLLVTTVLVLSLLSLLLSVWSGLVLSGLGLVRACVCVCVRVRYYCDL